MNGVGGGSSAGDFGSRFRVESLVVRVDLVPDPGVEMPVMLDVELVSRSRLGKSKSVKSETN